MITSLETRWEDLMRNYVEMAVSDWSRVEVTALFSSGVTDEEAVKFRLPEAAYKGFAATLFAT